MIIVTIQKKLHPHDIRDYHGFGRGFKRAEMISIGNIF